MRYLTKAQAQVYTGLSERTIDYARERGELPFFKVGKRVLLCRADLDAYLERHRVGADLDRIVGEVVGELRDARS
jgi:excisionase family DNA binding protein